MKAEARGGRTIAAMLAAGLLAGAGAPAEAEQCLAGSTGASGELQNTPVAIDWQSRVRFEPAGLPAGAAAVACRRRSIVPRPEDVRVLSEWHLPFGIVDEAGRALWISADAGRLEVTVDGGKLNGAEKKALKEWLDPANIRLVLEWNAR